MFAKMQEIRLKMLVCGENSPVKCSDTLLHLTEKEQGEADLELHLQNPCILFQGLEKKGLHYFKNPKCADYVLFEKRENLWCLHIFELKRTVKVKEWETMKDQFMGALQNALALAGFLDIKIAMDKVYLYSVYRNDKISDAANPSRLHFMPDNGRKNPEKDRSDWNNEILILDFGEELSFLHYKIQLDVITGNGKYYLAEKK